jgi:hypothetical protein
MLITLSRRAVISQSVAEVYLTHVATSGAVTHRFNFNVINHMVTSPSSYLLMMRLFIHLGDNSVGLEFVKIFFFHLCVWLLVR